MSIAYFVRQVRSVILQLGQMWTKCRKHEQSRSPTNKPKIHNGHLFMYRHFNFAVIFVDDTAKYIEYSIFCVTSKEGFIAVGPNVDKITQA